VFQIKSHILDTAVPLCSEITHILDTAVPLCSEIIVLLALWQL